MTYDFLLDVLIPTYKRREQVVIAATSVAKQAANHKLIDKVRISIIDDGSPQFSSKEITSHLAKWPVSYEVKKNTANKGMSLNILDMVCSSSGEFCTILTDDDWLKEGALDEIVKYLIEIKDRPGIGGIFTPRYSYLESGELYCVVCMPFRKKRLIQPGPVNSLKYCHNGFILTGFIFRTSLTAQKEWNENIENSWFPIINFSSILFSHGILFVNRRWFHHTVLNHCHWERWGANQTTQALRLYKDYMDAITKISKKAMASSLSKTDKTKIFYHQFYHYQQRMFVLLRQTGPNFICLLYQESTPATRKQLTFWLALLCIPVRQVGSSTKKLVGPWVKHLAMPLIDQRQR